MDRAVRGHTLTRCAIASKILSSVILIRDEEKYMTDLAYNVDATDVFQKLNSEKFRSIKNKFLNRFNEIEKNGPTFKLWLQYFTMLTILKQFIAAELSGDWEQLFGMRAKYVTVFSRF